MWTPPAWYVVFWGGAAIVFLLTQLAMLWLLYEITLSLAVILRHLLTSHAA